MKIPVRYNHVGYAPHAEKLFFVNPAELGVDNMDSVFFRIVRAALNADEPIYEGRLVSGTFEHRGRCEYTGEDLWSGNFSMVTDLGNFIIRIYKREGSLNEKLLFETRPFEISNAWILRQLKANIKSFYFQRSGVELTPEFAGKWARPAAHLDDKLKFHPSMQREGEWNAHGGWYDAGDYGKYIVNGGVSLATLLLACELTEKSDFRKESKFECESSDCRSDFLNEGGTFDLPYSLKDECRFELEFFLRMQDVDGGVFFKVTPEHWDGFVSPRDSDLLQHRLILGKSTTSTLNFAGTLAAASRVYRNEDPAFADRCLHAAVAAYRWAVSRPFVDYPHNTEGSGGYGDEHAEDEFFWTRAMLYRELHDLGEKANAYAAEDSGLSLDVLRGQLLDDMKSNLPKYGLDWRDTQNFGWIALALQDFDAELQQKARSALEYTALEIINLQKADAYGLSIRKFIWGSNGEVSNHALTLAIVRLWKPAIERNSLDYWCRELLNFVYGRNPVDVSFVTGSAWSSPMHPHHRLSHSDGVEEPIPGLLVGGLNSDRQDMHRAPHYPSALPGFSYTDERCSFASNETAINWNAPLTALLALLWCQR